MFLGKLSALFGKRYGQRRESNDKMIVSTRATEQPFSSQAEVDDLLLLRFFLDEEDVCIPYRHEEIVRFTDDEIERYHDFIQWIFPTSQPSRFNGEAPTIDEHFVSMFHGNQCVLQNYCKSCRRYLHYMDFDCNGDGNIRVYHGDRPFYRLPYHNFLRMTRMLQSLRETGHPQCSANLFIQMMDILHRTRNHHVSSTTIAYWKNTQKGNEIEPHSRITTNNNQLKPSSVMLGALIGDTVGSIYEFCNIKTTDFPLFSEGCSFTDDSVMTIAVADWLLHDPVRSQQGLEDSLVKWGHKYPDESYGGAFQRWLFMPEFLITLRDKSTDTMDGIPHGVRHPYNSWGNGSAMRAAACGWLAQSVEDALDLGRRSAMITHNHPEGIKGAQAVATAIYLARTGSPKAEIYQYIEETFGYDLSCDCDDIRPTYHFDVSCQGTLPAALAAFFDSHDFESAIRLAVSLGGDSDTIACITGAIAEAFYHEIPSAIVEEMHHRLPKEFWTIITEMYAAVSNNYENSAKDATNHNTQPRITPEYISELRPNEVFVFGSNARGMHYGGAAAFAVGRFGAIMGQGEGLQGQSYAIPTMEGMENMQAAVDRFIAFAKEHTELIFLVTPIGCGIAGYTPAEIAPLFAAAKTLDNVHLPNSFWNCLSTK